MKVTILGNIATIASKLTKVQIEELAKHRPAALKIVEDKKDVFAVTTGRASNASEFGIVFDGVDNASNQVFLTIIMDPKIKDKKKYIAENFGVAMARLQVVEPVAAAAHAELVTTLGNMAAAITEIAVTEATPVTPTEA